MSPFRVSLACTVSRLIKLPARFGGSEVANILLMSMRRCTDFSIYGLCAVLTKPTLEA